MLHRLHPMRIFSLYIIHYFDCKVQHIHHIHVSFNTNLLISQRMIMHIGSVDKNTRRTLACPAGIESIWPQLRHNAASIWFGIARMCLLCGGIALAYAYCPVASHAPVSTARQHRTHPCSMLSNIARTYAQCAAALHTPVLIARQHRPAARHRPRRTAHPAQRAAHPCPERRLWAGLSSRHPCPQSPWWACT